MEPTRTALVTGGSGSRGRLLCRQLVSHGTRVILHARTTERAETAAARLVADGADASLLVPVAADFRHMVEVMALADGPLRAHDRLDLLVNNTGAVDGTLQINYLAPYALTRLLAPALNAAGGRIVNLTCRAAPAHRSVLLFTRALACSTEQRVTAVAVDPGASPVVHAADPANAVSNGGFYEDGKLVDMAPGDDAEATRLWFATARLLGWDYRALRAA